MFTTFEKKKKKKKKKKQAPQMPEFNVSWEEGLSMKVFPNILNSTKNLHIRCLSLVMLFFISHL